jgi:hypothetical protein
MPGLVLMNKDDYHIDNLSRVLYLLSYIWPYDPLSKFSSGNL